MKMKSKRQVKQAAYAISLLVIAALVVVFFRNTLVPHSFAPVAGSMTSPATGTTTASTGTTTTSVAGANGSNPARLASLTLVGPQGGSTVDVGTREYITWTSNNYAAPTVTVNIIRKVSSNPARYELVRTVADAMSNRGNALWIPLTTDAGPDTFVQVACTLSAQACQASPIDTFAPLAVLDTGLYDNTADAYSASFKAIEALYNK